MSEPHNLETATLGSLTSEVDAALASLIDALTFAGKFGMFLPSNLKTELATAVSVLTSLKALVDKFA